MKKDSAVELIGLLSDAGSRSSLTGLKFIDEFDQNQARNIHEIRVITKRLRAYWRILRPLLKDKNTYSVHNNRLTAAARLLFGPRENYVNRKLIKSFKSNVKKHEQKKILDKLYDSIPEPGKVEDSTKETLKHCLIEEQKFWLQFDNSDLRSDVNPYAGVIQIYKKAKKFGKKSITLASSDLTTDVTHQWRKWSKYLLYQLEIVSVISDQNSISEYREVLKNLTGSLGESHDLNVLQHIISNFIRQHPLEVNIDKITKLIQRKNQTLSINYPEYYNKLFSEKQFIIPGSMHQH